MHFACATVQANSVVEHAEEAYHGEGKDYPLVNKDAKKFKSRMLEFWHSLVVKTKEEILYDDVLMTELIKVCSPTETGGFFF